MNNREWIEPTLIKLGPIADTVLAKSYGGSGNEGCGLLEKIITVGECE